MSSRFYLRFRLRLTADTGGYGSSAYYLDEQSEDCIVEKNVSVGIQRPSHNHMARRNTIRKKEAKKEAPL